MKKKYRSVAMGGTFDVLHLGHLDLLKKAFDISFYVVIGLTSDYFAKERLKKYLKNPFEIRLNNLEALITKEIGSTSFEITKLEEEFGPLMLSNKIDCLVASSETSKKGELINKLRTDKGLDAIDIITVELRMADDGLPISSTRIRNHEINPYGKVLGSKK
ncbi:MAG TPA: pantetheine-phosphate adenylyltransferase [Candidatus Nitrosocosmicus sp.]|nr:pantetheine-phosphate adenylyltransferase [Candidatus Nitrosocosmicus sp.]